MFSVHFFFPVLKKICLLLKVQYQSHLQLFGLFSSSSFIGFLFLMKISVPRFGANMFRIIMFLWLTVFDENEGACLPFLISSCLRSFKSGITIVMPASFPSFGWI